MFKLLALMLLCLLPACATATRGSHTVFVVQTVPDGALVTTDLPLPPHLREKTGDDGVAAAEFYGCQPTPCGFKLPRRSDFNVLVLKSGYQPSTHAVIKDRNRKAAKKSKNVAVGAGAVTATGYGTATAVAAANAGGLTAILLPTAAVATAGVIVAVPVVGTFSAVDMVSGALIDLNPNPLNVELQPETSPEETRTLMDAFERSRRAKQARQ